jgi:hypothetical protein
MGGRTEISNAIYRYLSRQNISKIHFSLEAALLSIFPNLLSICDRSLQRMGLLHRLFSRRLARLAL